MRSIRGGPSLLRHLSSGATAAGGPSKILRSSAAFTSSARSMQPRATGVAHASVSQVSSDGGELASDSYAAMYFTSGDQYNEAADKMPVAPFRRQRRQAEKEVRKREERRKKLEKNIFVQAGVEQTRISPYVRKDHQFKTFKPITPSLRWVRTSLQPHLHKGPPMRILTEAKRGTGGRNNHGHVTVRGRGGGHRRRIRLVDFHRWETGAQVVERIEYDPGRSAHIALIEHSVTKIKSYILAPDGLREGDTVQSYRLDEDAIKQGTGGSGSALDMGMFRTRAIRPGNVLPLRLIPIGTMVHALSIDPRGKSKLVRSAGSYGQLVAFVNKRHDTARQEGATTTTGEAASPPSASILPGSSPDAALDEARSSFEAQSRRSGMQGGASSVYAQVKLQSGEVRLLKSDCCATIGRVSNIDHEHERIGKAGRSRWMGRRPKVRGVAMNAVDHPHGGGRGKSKSNKHPRSIYGHKTKGPRTRKPGTRNGNKMVVRERPRGTSKRAA